MDRDQVAAGVLGAEQGASTSEVAAARAAPDAEVVEAADAGEADTSKVVGRPNPATLAQLPPPPDSEAG